MEVKVKQMQVQRNLFLKMMFMKIDVKKRMTSKYKTLRLQTGEEKALHNYRNLGDPDQSIVISVLQRNNVYS